MKLTSISERFRWDSSDPDRAPPPLPLNPGGSASPATKPNASATIAAAAEALTAKARESAYTTNPLPNKSPERSLIKGQYHKRMQSLQNGNGNIRDRSSYLDGSSSPERSPERNMRTPAFEYESRSPERSPTRSGTPTSSAKDFARDTPNLRPTTRPPPKAILGENTPPSATMLALQNMSVPKDSDTSLSNVTNTSSVMVRTPQTFDAISAQILSLTTIATNLQREMANLSRRSKDNATDLISLKEATNSRDEDIRKSLKDLVSNLSMRMLEPGMENSSRTASNYNRGHGTYMIDSKPHVSPSDMSKSFSLPRIPSPTSFAASLDREVTASPYNIEGAAGIALLEKILREMGTKEGQDRLMSLVSVMQNDPKAKGPDTAVTKKLEEILTFLKDGSSSRALVPRRDNGNGYGENPPKLELDFDSRLMPLTRTTKEMSPQSSQDTKTNGQKNTSGSESATIVSDEMLKLLKKVKDSIADGGGMTAEIKALVRELRGEVLGMGREIGRKLDQAETTHGEHNRDDARGPGREEIALIVQEGLAELKDHMDNVMRERRRQSSSSTVSRNSVDSQEVYTAVKNALGEIPFQQQMALNNHGSGIEREEILEAVREAWETYKPEIELQNFGLERDEILQCLKEGLQEYQPRDQTKALGGASYEEVLEAVREGLQHFKPPAPVENEDTITREDILMTVRDCLDNFEFPTSGVVAPREPEMTREAVLDAVKEGLSTQAPTSKEVEFNREDLFEAVRAGLEGAPTPMDGVGEQVLDKMQDLIDGMKGEFKQYSAANGGDTEQVLDAMKDGLEVLRADIETYVDRAADVTGKDEIIETIRDGLANLRLDLEGSIANAPRGSEPADNGEILDALEKEFEHLRQTIATSMVRNEDSDTDKEAVLDAIRDEFGGLKASMPPGDDLVGTNEIIRVMKEEFEHLQETLGTTLVRNGDNGTDKEEVLYALREELGGLKASMPRGDLEGNDETIRIMKEEFEYLRETLATTLVRGAASTDKEEMLETIREGLESVRAEIGSKPEKAESIMSNTGELIEALNDGLDGLRVDVERMVNKPQDMTVNYEILDTLKEGLSNVRSDMERLRTDGVAQSEFAGRGGGEVVVADGEVENLRRNDIENLEVMITQLRIKVEALDNMPPPPPPQPVPQPAEGLVAKDDLEGIELLLRDVQAAIADLAQRERAFDENVATKDDTEAIETLLRNTKAKIDEVTSAESEGLARVAQLEAIELIVKDTRDAVNDSNNETATKEDVSVLELLLKEVRIGLEEIRDKSSVTSAGDQVSKSDIEALETLCMDTKTQIDKLPLPDVDMLPTKDEIELLGGLIKGFQEKVEVDADLTAQAFEARKIEHGGLADKIEEVKAFLDDVREDLKTKLKEGDNSVQDLAKTLMTITETVVATDGTAAIKELLETVNRGFDSVHGASEEVKLETDQKHVSLLEKHDEHKAAILAELNSKIDERFDEIMTKYDDAQLAAEEKERTLGGKDEQRAEALNTTKLVAEDLRLLVDTLGSTVTDSCDRMGEDSKTVFNRIEDIGTKLDQLLLADERVEHQATRAEVSRTLAGVEGVQAHVTEYQPKILEAVKDVLSIVGQHYEQAKTSVEEIKTSVNAIPSAIPLPAITAPLPSPTLNRDIPLHEKYDDSEVHAKLDQLVEHTREQGQSLAQVGLLEQIREQVATTANGFNAFVARQQATIMEAVNSRAKEAEEVAIALEKRTAQKEAVEADVVRLSEQKDDLSSDIHELSKEKEDLMAQRSRMQADLSSLHTALEIRREELHVMEARADGLERRILDGVLDHSRSLLTTSRPQSSLKEMNLKRVASSASHTTTATRTSTAATTVPSLTASTVSSGIGMALKRRQPPKSTNQSSVAGNGDRRILSLSTLGANKGAGVERSMVLANPSNIGAAKGSGFGVKRSHSVKSNFPVRKASWGGTKALGMYGDDGVDNVEDKENSVLDEADEEEEEDLEGSEAGTERRTSYSGTYTGTGSYGEGSTISSDDRRTSYAASTIGTVGYRDGVLQEEEELDSEPESLHEVGQQVDGGEYHGDIMATRGQISNAGEMVVFGPPSDSGIGTDIPTTTLEGGSDYFKRG